MLAIRHIVIISPPLGECKDMEWSRKIGVYFVGFSYFLFFFGAIVCLADFFFHFLPSSDYLHGLVLGVSWASIVIPKSYEYGME